MAFQARTTQVDGDTEQPGAERRVALKRLEGAQRRDKNLLRYIICLIRVIENGECQPVHILLVALHQAFYGQRISRTALFKPVAVHDGHSNGLDKPHLKIFILREQDNDRITSVMIFSYKTGENNGQKLS